MLRTLTARIVAAVTLALAPAAAPANELTWGTIWTPETIEQKTSSTTPRVFVFGQASFAPGGAIQLGNLPESGYLEHIDLQVYGDQPATLTFPLWNYSVDFTPAPANAFESHAVTSIDLPGLPFFGWTASFHSDQDLPVIQSAGALSIAGFGVTQFAYLDLLAGLPAATSVEHPYTQHQRAIGIRYTVGLLPGDITADGAVTIDDFGELKLAFGTHDARADTDSSGRVDLGDFGLLKENFGRNLRDEPWQAPAAVPEPSTWAMALISALWLTPLARRFTPSPRSGCSLRAR